MSIKTIKNITSLALILFLFPFTCIASNSAEMEAQRKAFVSAEQALEQGDKRTYLKLKKSLGTYPLLPYLEFKELKQHIAEVSNGQAKRFLSSYAGTPLQARFRNIWLNDLARRGQWWTYLAFYKPKTSIKQECIHLQALLNTGQTTKAWKKVPSLWLSADSRPNECDPPFEAWREAGKLTTSLVWKRIDLAMQKNKLSMVRYLKRFLPQKEQPWLDLWLSVHKTPGLLLHQEQASGSHAYLKSILLHGIRRLAREDPEHAVKLLKKLKSRHNFTDEQQYRTRRSIVLTAIHTDKADRLQDLDMLRPRDKDQYLHETLIRNALNTKSWQQALGRLEQLPPALQHKESWQYWRARLLDKLNRQDEAEHIYKRLAQERSYYGFLAADRLGLNYQLQNVPLSSDHEAVTTLSKRPSMLRAHELFVLGRLHDARREWNLALDGVDKKTLQLAAKLAQSWNWHPQAIFTLARTAYWDDLELRFPIEHEREIAHRAKSQCLDDAWILAVVRQESAFATDARSIAGAQGLMQLMPKTARFIARKTGLKPPKKKELYDPKINIQLGTAYLRKVMDQLAGNQVLATAAYNAGPHRVKSWLPEETISADLWIETIPFSETRKYTQRVLAYSVIYDQRLGRKPRLLKERMVPIQPVDRTIARLSSPLCPIDLAHFTRKER